MWGHCWISLDTRFPSANNENLGQGNKKISNFVHFLSLFYLRKKIKQKFALTFVFGLSCYIRLFKSKKKNYVKIHESPLGNQLPAFQWTFRFHSCYMSNLGWLGIKVIFLLSIYWVMLNTIRYCVFTRRQRWIHIIEKTPHINVLNPKLILRGERLKNTPEVQC